MTKLPEDENQSLAMTLLQEIEAAILVDEIGMRSARLGDYVVTAFYRPIFARTAEDLLVPAAVHGVPGIHAGRTLVLGQRQFGAVIPRAERALAMALATTLQAENLVPADLGDLDLIIDVDSALLDQLPLLATRLHLETDAPTFMEPASGTLIASLPATAHRLPEFASLAESLGDNAFGLALGPAGIASLPPMPIPMVLRLSASLLRRLLQHEAGESLLEALIPALRRRGIALLVEEISDAAMLETALALGADLIAGDLLAKPQAAGLYLERDGLSLDALLAAPAG